jgi:hypothetical protein
MQIHKRRNTLQQQLGSSSSLFVTTIQSSILCQWLGLYLSSLFIFSSTLASQQEQQCFFKHFVWRREGVEGAIT